MATLGNALIGKLLGHSAAEKAFRPWWDNFEDFLMYGLVMLGLIVAPTAIINSTPLDCNLCQESNCKFAMDRNITVTVREDPKYNAWWVKKYCTMTAIDGFILYFPYILLVMALIMVLIDRGFIRAFNTGLKLDTFYNLLVKESEHKEEEKADDGGKLDLEETRGAIEVSHSFMSRSNYFVCYIVRTLSELIVASSLLIWLGLSGVPSIKKEEFILCNVYGYFYECAGHPQQFYMYVVFAVMVILVMYLLCNLYSLLWLTIPQMGTLGTVMAKYRQRLRETKSKGGVIKDEELLGDLYKIYYNNRDLRLLLDLLATSSGIAPSLRILALFDKNLRFKIEPGNVHISQSFIHSRMSEANIATQDGVQELQQKKEVYDIEVEFEDAEAIRDIFSTIKNITYLYTVEIQPPTDLSAVTAVEIDKDGKVTETEVLNECGDGGCEVAFAGTELEPLENGTVVKKRCMRVPMYHLDPKKEYKIRVCTIVNGRTIARKVERIRPKEPTPEPQAIPE